MTERIRCDRCGANFAPKLTRWTCPVCDAAPEGLVAASRLSAWNDSDNRLLAIVAAATIGNVLLLGVLAALVLHS